MVSVYYLDLVGQDSPLKTYVEKIRHVLMRRDRIVWAMRYMKLLVVQEVKDIIADPHVDFIKEVTGYPPCKNQPELDAVIENLSWLDTNWLCRVRHRSSLKPNAYEAIDYLLSDISHYIQMGESLANNPDRPSPNNPLRAYIFNRQSVVQVISDLSQIEEDIKDLNRRPIEHTNGSVLLQFKSKWTWFDLETQRDDREGSAMGHCGNAAGEKGDTVLSLREPINSKWLPHLTFILEPGGVLGEMKGFGNQKPKPKYHEYIVSLLKNERIREVRGGGYKPENNFCLFISKGMPVALNGWTDLSLSLAKNLHDIRPQIWRHDGVCHFCSHNGGPSGGCKKSS